MRRVLAKLERARPWRLPEGLDLMVFDYGANESVTRSVKFLQTQLRVMVDGHCGDITRKAAAACNVTLTCRRLATMQREFLASLPTEKRFPGLLTRTDRREAAAVALYRATLAAPAVS
jgi:lysozyme family protein